MSPKQSQPQRQQNPDKSNNMRDRSFQIFMGIVIMVSIMSVLRSSIQVTASDWLALRQQPSVVHLVIISDTHGEYATPSPL